MASSNRHWPSMFKSKPCNPHHHHLPWQPSDMNPSSLISSTTSHRTPFTSSSTTSGCEERSLEPKPRWNPKPEQIRILEAIFNSGMVNPPRNEIRKIRAQLEEFGQVGDANVFYWFQNRKSRSKHKLRNNNNLQNSNKINKSSPSSPTLPIPHPKTTQFSPSNSSSDNNNNIKASSPNSSSSSNKEMITLLPPSPFSIVNGFSSDIIHLPTSPTNPTTYFHNDTSLNNNSETFFFPSSSSHQGFCFSELSGLVQHQNNVGPCTSLLLSEMMNQKKQQDHHNNKDMKSTIMNYPHHHLSFCVAPPSSSSVTPTTVLPTSMVTATTTTTTSSVTVPSLVSQIQGEEASGTSAKSIVYINDVAFEISVGPFNVHAAFGEDAVLVHAATGHPVLTNEWGVTFQPLHHGAFYYLI